LDALNLLRDCTEDPLLQSIELVEASPRSDLAQSDEDPSHRLEVEGFVAAEDEDESSELDSESLDGFGLSWRARKRKGDESASTRREGGEGEGKKRTNLFQLDRKEILRVDC